MIQHFFPWIRIRLSWRKNLDPDPTLNLNEEKNISIFSVDRHKIRVVPDTDFAGYPANMFAGYPVSGRISGVAGYRAKL